MVKIRIPYYRLQRQLTRQHYIFLKLWVNTPAIYRLGQKGNVNKVSENIRSAFFLDLTKVFNAFTLMQNIPYWIRYEIAKHYFINWFIKWMIYFYYRLGYHIFNHQLICFIIYRKYLKFVFLFKNYNYQIFHCNY